jgi:uncharacterized membrane protein
MFDKEAIRQEIKSLKKDTAEIKQRLSSLEQKTGLSTPAEIPKKPQKNSMPAGAIILIVLGSLLSLTVLGAIIGVPLLIWGIILTNKSSQKKVPQQKGPKPQKPIREAETSAPLESKKREPQTSIEEAIGTKWFSWIGILALVIGVGFFIKYAIEANWINYLARIILGIVFGVSLIAFGETISKRDKYLKWGQTLTGGGLALSYFVVYAAYYFKEYRLAIGISQSVDIILLVSVVALAIALSLKNNSQVIAAESFFLGYVTSLLSNNFEALTLIYFLILTLGLVAVVSYKKWALIGLGGVLASYGLYILWNAKNPYSFSYASLILITIFAAFSFQSVFLAKRKDLFAKNVAITLVNSISFFILFYLQIDKHHPEFASLFASWFAILYLLGYSAFRRIKETKFAIVYLYLALLFITLAIPIHFSKELMTIAWALEALIVAALFVKFKIKTLKVATCALGIIVFIKTLFYDSIFLNGFNRADLMQSSRLISYIFSIAAFYIIYVLLRKNKDILPNRQKCIPAFYSWGAAAFVTSIAFIEFADSYNYLISIMLAVLSLVYIMISRAKNKEFLYQALALSGILFVKALMYDSYDLSASMRIYVFASGIAAFYIISLYLEKRKLLLNRAETPLINIYSYGGTILAFTLILIEMEEFWISVGWSILAMIIMVLGFAFRKKSFRMQAMIIFAVTIFKVFLYDTRNLDTIYRTLSYMVLGGLLLLVSFIYTKYRDKLKEIL